MKILYSTLDTSQKPIRLNHYFKKELEKIEGIEILYVTDEAYLDDIMEEHNFVPDFIFFDDFPHNHLIHGIKDTSIPKGVLYWDVQKNQNSFRNYVNENKMDIIFVFHRGAFLGFFPEFREKVHWFPNHIYTEEFKDYQLPKEYDFLLMGALNETVYPLRTKIAREMKGYNGFVHHEHPGYGDVAPIEEQEKLVGVAYAQEINKAKIFFTDDSIYKFPIAKYFEVPACNTLLMATGSYDLEALGFINGKTFVEITEDNYYDKAIYYLEHEEERNRIARNGYDMVRARHTTEIRAREFVEFIRKYSMKRKLLPNRGPKTTVISSADLLDKIIQSLDNQLPLSVVSVGATESFVMAQYKILSKRQFMRHAEAKVANLGKKRGHKHRGIRFPNIAARNMAVEAMKKVDIAGYNMHIWDMNSGELTEKVFDHYDIWPMYVFEANIRRVIMLSQQEKFHQMLARRRILIVCNYADEVKDALNTKLKEKLNFEIVGTVYISEFEEIPQAKEEIKSFDFDLCLLAAGVNAIILAVFIADELGKVAFDLGQGLETLITDTIQDDDKFLEKNIGISRLMSL